MANDLQNEICRGNCWSSSRNTSSYSPPCSSALDDIDNFGWHSQLAEIKERPCELSESAYPASISGNSLIFPTSHKVQPPDFDYSLQMAGFGPWLVDWSHALLPCNGRAETSLQVLQEEPTYTQDSSIGPAQLNKDWNSKFSCDEEPLKQLDHALSVEQLNSRKISSDFTDNCQKTPINGELIPYTSSTLLQGLLDEESQLQELDYYGNGVTNFPSGNYRTNFSSEDFLASSPRFPQFVNKSLPPKQQGTNQLNFSNNAPFWNPSSAMNDLKSSLFVTQTLEEKFNLGNLTTKENTEEAYDQSLEMKKSSDEPAHKRPRMETPLPLPTFKVRKEKLGDRVTALQQLVSPFGKTDTASVLWEAIEYIKILHEQVNVLSDTYMKNGALMQNQQNSDKSKDTEAPKQDLRSRGLCLVPISSTFPVANESIAEFWIPSFSGTYV